MNSGEIQYGETCDLPLDGIRLLISLFPFIELMEEQVCTPKIERRLFVGADKGPDLFQRVFPVDGEDFLFEFAYHPARGCLDPLVFPWTGLRDSRC